MSTHPSSRVNVGSCCMHGVLQRANTINEAELSRRHSSCTSIGSMSEQQVVVVVGAEGEKELSPSNKCDLNNNNNLMKSTTSFDDSPLDDIRVFPKSFAWDWPFCDEGIARGVYTEEKFLVCLPFNSGGTGEKNGSTKKFEKISESNFSWTIGLSNNSNEFGGTTFWRMELEIIRNLNMLALIVSRDISRYESGPKRLKRVRKVYRLPTIYDIRTIRTTSYDWAIVIEASRRRDVRTNRPMRLKRSDTLA